MKNYLKKIIIVLVGITCLSSLADNGYDIVISGGRVIDPETGLDGIRNIGINGDQIVEISKQKLKGKNNINANGLVVSPGFIDLHAHGQSNKSHEYQVHDGVTTALELEGGIYGVGRWLNSKKDKSLINFGASTSHYILRDIGIKKYNDMLPKYISLIEQFGFSSSEVDKFYNENLASANYVSLNKEQIEKMNKAIIGELKAGGLGIGLLVGYLPGATQEEIFHLFKVATKNKAPIFVHVRFPGIVGIQEVIADAAITGTPLHIVHINSMALGEIELAIDMVEAAQGMNLDITTEMYPYTAASTSLESALFDDGWQDRLNISYSDLQWQDTGERLTEESFKKYREKGGIVIIHVMKEEWIAKGIGRASTMIASDGMPYSPLAHPRSAGTFSRLLGRYVREKEALSLFEAINKITLMPAKRLEDIAPAMTRKGRIQLGADADITIFDPSIVKDTATFEGGLSFSEGISYVLVNGKMVVNEGKTVKDIFPGKAVLGKYKQ